MAGALVVAVLSMLLVSRDLTSLMRNQREIRYLITPGNYIYGLVGSLAHGARDARAPREPVGTDARMIRVAMAPQKPRVFVLVVGETVRAANFSLLGSYARPTTPELAKTRRRGVPQRDLLRHLHRSVGALHVFAVGPRRL